MGTVFRLQDSLYNTPLLIIGSSLDGCISYLNSRNSGEFELSASNTDFTNTNEPVYDSATKIGTLSINGPLTYRSSILTALCGLQSYQSLQTNFQKLIDKGAKKIVLWVDSPGGEAYAMQETATVLRTLADKHRVKILAYADGVSASAAYGLSCAAHEIVANPQAQLGSIGVVVKLCNTNKALSKAGIEETFLFAGDNKVAFDKSGDWDKNFLADLQEKIDKVYGDFTSFVAKNRAMSVKDVVNTQAKMFLAEDAVKLGLADKVMTREQFANYLTIDKQPSKLIVAMPVIAKAETKLTTPAIAATPLVKSASVVVDSVPEGYTRNPLTNYLEVDRTPKPQAKPTAVQRAILKNYKMDQQQ